MYLNVIGINKIFRYTEHFVTQRFVISRVHCTSYTVIFKQLE